MVKKYDCELPECIEERIYDHPNVDDGNLTERVEITPNPAYGIVTTCM